MGNGDLRSAQKRALNNALMGGLRLYVEGLRPAKPLNIGEEHLTFIKSYAILSRTLSGDSVETTVRLNIDDAIGDEAANNMVSNTSQAVFVVTGLPDYMKTDDVRRALADIFRQYQYSTNDQIAFEQEVIDQENHSDLLSAFQSISAQYVYNFHVKLTDLAAGSSCTLVADTSYATATKSSSLVHLMRKEVVANDSDAAKCVQLALNKAVDAALLFSRGSVAQASAQKAELYNVTISFEGQDAKTTNSVIDTLKKRRIVLTGDMSSFDGNVSIFEVTGYLAASALADRIRSLGFDGVAGISQSGRTVNIKLKNI
ncbi:hypothetical protein AGMMS49941_01520 [Deferribacterales bacterium]|nr:hypothetical protein AGMMS49941_01520 [Deferribacterales bacterium]